MDLLQMRGLLLTIFAACIGGTFQSGLNMTIINAPTTFIQMFINETWIERYGKPLESGVITLFWTIIITAFCVGGLVGALIAGPMAITCGRRDSLLLSNIFVLVGTLLMGLSKTAKSFEMILIGRFFTGISSGVGHNIIPMYLGESAPKKIRGIVALSYAPFTAAGLVIGQALGLSEVLGREETWPILLSASAVPALIQLAILPWCPESPRYLLIDREDKDMCMKALKQLRGNANLTSEIDEMLEEQSVLEGENAKKIWDVFIDRSVRRQLMITMVLGSAVQLCGNDAQMYYYAAYLFRAVGISDENVPYVTIGTGCCELVAALTSNLFVDRAGRRLLLMGGYGLMVISGIFFTISLALQDKISWMPYMSVISIFASIVSFGIGPGVTGIIPMEIFDQTARPAAYMINGLLFWINFIIIGLTFPFIVEGLGSFCYVPFLSLSFFFVVFIGVFLPETKGKTFLEISKEFRKQNFRGLM
ncbi:solute carrier family 2, facilitated glucose transporter member 11-like isoform X3 [Hemitrygon akajei]|uniref:solute carrier family 2, facilitated glucose transporter member 11-like isoform X3 n=1 Tax=Hemitrygon akajei TaxID=2704970 RepID=UPI003BFA1562